LVYPCGLKTEVFSLFTLSKIQEKTPAGTDKKRIRPGFMRNHTFYMRLPIIYSPVE